MISAFCSPALHPTPFATGSRRDHCVSGVKGTMEEALWVGKCAPLRCYFLLCHARTGLAGSDGRTGTPVHTWRAGRRALGPPLPVPWRLFGGCLLTRCLPCLLSHDEMLPFGSDDVLLLALSPGGCLQGRGVSLLTGWLQILSVTLVGWFCALLT